MQDSLIQLFGFNFVFPAQIKQIMLAALIGIILGFERELRGKKASLRTFSYLTVGSCLFTLLSISAVGTNGDSPHDITRIAAQIVSGVGFLGGGVIFKSYNGIEGITTAAMIWFASAMGMACGFNQIQLVIWTCIIAFVMYPLCESLHNLFRMLRLRHLLAQRHSGDTEV